MSLINDYFFIDFFIKFYITVNLGELPQPPQNLGPGTPNKILKEKNLNIHILKKLKVDMQGILKSLK